MVTGLPRRGDGPLCDIGYGSATAKVRMALQASSEPTKALPSPLPTVPLLLVILISKRSVSPGIHGPAELHFVRPAEKDDLAPRLRLGKNGDAPRSAPAPRVAAPPGTPGARGNGRGTRLRSGSRSFSATAYSPGTSSMTRSRNKKGSRWGRMASICVRSSMAHLLSVGHPGRECVHRPPPRKATSLQGGSIVQDESGLFKESFLLRDVAGRRCSCSFRWRSRTGSTRPCWCVENRSMRWRRSVCSSPLPPLPSPSAARCFAALVRARSALLPGHRRRPALAQALGDPRPRPRRRPLRRARPRDHRAHGRGRARSPRSARCGSKASGRWARFHTLVNPQRPIPPMITHITGITQEMVADAPRIEQVVPELLEFLEGAVIVAHNAAFDVGFLNYELQRLKGRRLGEGAIDTLPLARLLAPGLAQLPPAHRRRRPRRPGDRLPPRPRRRPGRGPRLRHPGRPAAGAGHHPPGRGPRLRQPRLARGRRQAAPHPRCAPLPRHLPLPRQARDGALRGQGRPAAGTGALVLRAGRRPHPQGAAGGAPGGADRLGRDRHPARGGRARTGTHPGA